MKRSEYPIAVIDEQLDQLEELEQAFERAGKHCFKIQYDVTYSGEPYSAIELLFLDINLNPGAGQSDNALYATLEGAISTYISDENGPYVLVFWTSLPDLVDGFKSYISRDKNSPVYKHRPIFVDTLAKEDFQVNPAATLDNILNNPIVNLVFSLHKNLRDASSNAFKELMNCVPRTEEWGSNDDYLEAFKKVFTKIAVTSVGAQNAISIPDKAIFEVVGREVSHQLIKYSKDEWKNLLSIDENKTDEVKGILYEDWQYSLNTVFHVEPDKVNKTDRGAVLTGKKLIFDCLLGKDLYDWMKEEYQLSKTQDDGYRFIPVAVEISPACDYAQSKPRLYKFVLGVCRISKDRPSNNIESYSTPPFKSRGNHGVLPTFYVDGRYYKVVVSYNYMVGLKASTINRLDHIMTLRGEIVNQLSNLFAEHSSRIGIIDINEK